MATLNTNTTINTASTTALNKTYIDRDLLAFARTQFKHAKYGQKRNIPPHNGKVVEFRRWELFDPNNALGGLTEGVTPAGQALGQTTVEATLKQYGAYVTISDLADKTFIDDAMDDSVELLGEQIGTVIEWVTRDAMNAGTTVQYTGGKTSRATLTASDKLTTDDIRKAVRTLKKNKVRWFNGSDGKGRGKHLICICSPDATYDLQSDSNWQDVSKYSNAEQIYSGEIGKMFGVVFVESTEAKVWAGAGATNGGKKADVHSALVFGRDAYGTIDIGSSGAIKSIVKGFGSAGTEDPLNQRATVGAKVMAYTAKILNDDWIVRIEHGVSDGETVTEIGGV